MIFITESYGTVFEPKVEEKVVRARYSTSEKNQNGDCINSSWNIVFLGGALEKAKQLKDRQRIHINKAKLTNRSYKDKEGNSKWWMQITAFDFDILEHGTKSNNNNTTDKTVNKSKQADKPQEIDEDDLPF